MMYIFKPTDMGQITSDYDFSDVFKTLCLNGLSVGGVVEELCKISLMNITDDQGNMYGFFSLEECEENGVEVHAFIVPSQRGKSKEILKSFAEAIFTLTPYTLIKTTVSSDYQPLVRFLGMIGFAAVNVAEGVVHKNGQVYNMTTLKLYKGE